MAGEGTTIATAWVQLAFSASGIKKQIQDELDGSGAAKAAGDRTGQGFLNGLGGALGTVGKVAAVAMAAVGVAAAGAAVKGIAAFAGFQGQMNEVFTLLPGISESAMDAMSGDVKNFSKEFGVLPEKVVPALYQALSAGVPSGNVFDFLEVAQKAAKGGVADLTTAVDGISSVVNAYGAEAIGASEASDLMFTAVRLGKTTFAELSSSLFNVNPIAASLGVNFGDVTAALAAMTAQGVPTSVATTQLRAAFTELSKEGTKTSDIFKAYAGKTFKEFIAAGGNTQEALQILEEAAGSTGLAINDLFGSSEAGSAALALTGKGTEAFSKAIAEMGTSAGATDQAFKTMNKGLGPVFDRLKAGLQVFLIDIGQKLAPIVEAALVKVGEVFTKVQQIALPIINTIILSFRALVDAFKSPDVTSDGLVGVFERIGVFARQAFDVIRNIDFGAIFSRAVDFIKPVVVALLDLGSSVGGFLIESFKTLKQLFQDNQETLKTLGSGLLRVGTVVKNVLASALRTVAGTFDFLARNMEAVKLVAVPLIAAFVTYKTVVTAISTVTKIWAAVTKIMAAAQIALNVVMSLNPIGVLIAAIAALVAGVIYAYTHFEGFRNVIDSIGDAIQWVYNWVKDNWKTILALLAGPVGVAVLLISKHWDTIKDAVSAMVKAVGRFIGDFIDFFKRLPRQIIDAIGNFAGLLVSKGTDLINGLINGFVGAFSWLSSVIGGLAGNIIGWIGSAINWLYGTGQQIISGIINGIHSMFTNLATIWWGMGTTIRGWIGSAASWLYHVGRDMIQGLINGVWDKAQALASAVRSIVTTSGIDIAKNALGIGSPSKVFMEIGADTMEGFQIGIDRNPPRWDLLTPDAPTFASTVLATVGGASGASLAGNGVGARTGPPLVLNQTNNTNADPDEIAAATMFRFVTSGVV